MKEFIIYGRVDFTQGKSENQLVFVIDVLIRVESSVSLNSNADMFWVVFVVATDTF